MDGFKKNYRITIEPISEEAKDLPDELRIGVECEGFTLIADLGRTSMTSIQNVSLSDLACSFAKESKLMRAAHIGKAIREAAEMEGKDALSELLKRAIK